MSTPAPVSNETHHKNSKLVPVGIVLILIGLFLPAQLDNFTRSMPHSLIWKIVMISTDLVSICFFAGIGCCVIGVLRNRKSKPQATRSEA